MPAACAVLPGCGRSLKSIRKASTWFPRADLLSQCRKNRRVAVPEPLLSQFQGSIQPNTIPKHHVYQMVLHRTIECIAFIRT
jgi:hypothetical protein